MYKWSITFNNSPVKTTNTDNRAEIEVKEDVMTPAIVRNFKMWYDIVQYQKDKKRRQQEIDDR